jgi:hypothetical protein
MAGWQRKKIALKKENQKARKEDKKITPDSRYCSTWMWQR